MLETALLALGLVLIVEGLVYALAPSLIEQMLMGAIALVLGLILVWAAKTLGA